MATHVSVSEQVGQEMEHMHLLRDIHMDNTPGSLGYACTCE